MFTEKTGVRLSPQNEAYRYAHFFWQWILIQIIYPRGLLPYSRHIYGAAMGAPDPDPGAGEYPCPQVVPRVSRGCPCRLPLDCPDIRGGGDKTCVWCGGGGGGFPHEAVNVTSTTLRPPGTASGEATPSIPLHTTRTTTSKPDLYFL